MTGLSHDACSRQLLISHSGSSRTRVGFRRRRDLRLRPQSAGGRAVGVRAVRAARVLRLSHRPADGRFLAAVSKVPPQSIILYLTMFRDGAGQTFVPHDVASRISTAARVLCTCFSINTSVWVRLAGTSTALNCTARRPPKLGSVCSAANRRRRYRFARCPTTSTCSTSGSSIGGSSIPGCCRPAASSGSAS